MAKNQNLQEVEKVIANYSRRASMITYDEQIFNKLKLLKDRIKEGCDATYIAKVMEFVNAEPSKKSMIKRACEVVAKNPSRKNLLKANLAIDTIFGNEEAKYLCKNIKLNPEEVKSYLAGKSKDELEQTMNNVIRFYSKEKSFRLYSTVNKILEFGGKKICRKVCGIEGKDKISYSTEENSMLRAVFAGGFMMGKDDSYYSDAFKQWQSGGVKKSNSEEYNLLKNNPLFRMVKNSYNIQQVVPVVEKELKKLGVPAKLANQLNSSDLAVLIGKGGNAFFSELSNKCVDSPRQEFCKKLVKNEEIVQSLEVDFLAYGASKEYFSLWLDKMKKYGDSTLKISGYEKDAEAIGNIDVHHKGHLSSAFLLEECLEANGDLMLILGRMNHDIEHGTDKKYCSAKMTKNADGAMEVASLSEERGCDGDYAFIEYLVVENDNRVYKSDFRTMCSDGMACNKDLEKGKPNTKPGNMVYKVASNEKEVA